MCKFFCDSGTCCYDKTSDCAEKVADIGSGLAAGGGVWAFGAILQAAGLIGEVTMKANPATFIVFTVASLLFGGCVASIKTHNRIKEYAKKNEDACFKGYDAV